jgi:hypothetical protein
MRLRPRRARRIQPGKGEVANAARGGLEEAAAVAAMLGVDVHGG